MFESKQSPFLPCALKISYLHTANHVSKILAEREGGKNDGGEKRRNDGKVIEERGDYQWMRK